MQILEKNVTHTWGKKGKEWLSILPSIIESLSNYWSLTNIKPVNNMSYNYVALAFQQYTIPVVLKISCDQQLIQDEYKALKHFDGHGAIKILGINTEFNALLLEQALPGHLLKERYPRKITDIINVYSNVIKVLASQSLSNANYLHVSKWCNAIDRIQDQRIEKRFVDKAKQLRSALLGSARHEYLCHGDLHLENIIQHGSNWLVIDPKGIIGEIAFEAAAFDLINKDEMKDTSTISSKINDRVTKLATTLNLDFERLLSWIFLRIIISAQWFVEDNGDPNEMLVLANQVYPLLNNCIGTIASNQSNFTFEKAKACHKEIIYSWLNEPHVQEFWDNTQAHKDDIVNFMQGRVTSSNYANGEYVYWVGSIDNVPYCMIMTIEEKAGQDRPKIKNDHLSKRGSTYSLEFMIGNKDYFGKGLGAKTLTKFLVFFKDNFDTNADTFFIDPDVTNSKAKHVYEKAGFTFIGDFIMEGNVCFVGHKTHFLVKKLIS